MPLEVKAAVQKAEAYLRQAFNPVTDLRLEEVELTPDVQRWLITLSFVDRSSLVPIPQAARREYKTVELDASSGEVRSIKIRVLNES